MPEVIIVMRGRCGSEEQLRSYIEQHYMRRYRASYTLTDYNLFLAVQAYHYGVLNQVGIDTATRAICETYKCSYKRLSNFLRELRLWDAETNDWVLPVCQKTVNSRYTGKKRIEVWDLVLSIPHPFLFEVRPVDENDRTAALLAEDVGINLGVYPLASEMVVKKKKVEEVEGREVVLSGIKRVSEEVTEETKLLSEVVRGDKVVIEWELTWNKNYEYDSKDYGEIEEEAGLLWRKAK